MPRLIDPVTGDLVWVDDLAEAQERGLELPGGQATVRDEDGGAVTINSVGQMARSAGHGFTPESAEGYRERQVEETYGDSSLRAGLEGVARTATFGLSDIGQQALFGESAEAIRSRKELNPTAALVGEVAGALVPVGAASVAGKVGKAVEGSLAREGSSFLRTALSRGSAYGAEGALYGAGSGVSELAIGEPEVNAENIIATVGGNAFVGFGLGAGLGVGVGVAGLGKLVKGRGGAAAEGATVTERGASALAKRGAKGDPDLSRLIDDVAGPRGRKIAGELQGKTPELNRRLADAFDDGTKTLSAHVDEAKRMVSNGMKSPVGDLDELVKTAQAVEDDAAKLFVKRSYDPRASGFVERFEFNLAKASPEDHAALKSVLDRRQQVSDDLAKALNKEPRAFVPEDVELGRAWRQAEASFVEPKKGLLSRALDFGGEVRPVMGALGAGALGVNPAIGVGVGLVGKVVQGLEASRSPFKVVSWFRRMEVINQRVTEGINKGVEGLVGVGGKVPRSSLAGAAVALSDDEDRFHDASTVGTMDRIDRARRTAAQPEVAAEALRRGLQEFSEAAPQTVDAIVQRTARVASYLSDKAPKDPRPEMPPALRAPWVPSEADLAKWRRIERAADDPRTLLRDMANGTVSREVVQTVRDLWPDFMSRLQQSLMSRLSEVEEPVGPDVRRQIGMILGGSLDRDEDPASIAFFRQMHAKAREAGKGSQGGTSGNLTLSEDMTTDVDRISG